MNKNTLINSTLALGPRDQRTMQSRARDNEKANMGRLRRWKAHRKRG